MADDDDERDCDGWLTICKVVLVQFGLYFYARAPKLWLFFDMACVYSAELGLDIAPCSRADL